MKRYSLGIRAERRGLEAKTEEGEEGEASGEAGVECWRKREEEDAGQSKGVDSGPI